MKGGWSIIHKFQKQIMFICFIIYTIAVLWYTVLKRQAGFQRVQFEPFWSYNEWMNGDWELGKEIMANIAMFVPFGFLLSTLHTKRCIIIPVAILFSLIIETLQLFFMRGLFEWDDVISNTIGAAIGGGLYRLLEAFLVERNLTIASTVAAIVFAFISLSVFIIGRNSIEEDSSSRAYCFQIDDVVVDEEVALSGFAFQYDQPDRDYSLELRSIKDGTRTSLVTSRTARLDVEDYFGCGEKNTGFTAKGKFNPDSEYEILIRWSWIGTISTGVFVSSSGIHYVPENDFTLPAIDAPFVEDGILRVYRPDYHCWVYQYHNDLYWIADQDFNFEPDNSTYIQYQLWTTQTDKLPQHRLDNNWLWDNIGGNFEDYELEGDWNGYRVMKRELPTAYPITSIVTGYHKDGKWIWKEYFRPYYEFD